ncbi:MAG: NAD+ synthase [Acidimicrobiia bacterium]|nr:NAD+ synthase [Acidimicrobiia bacterium]
MFLRVAGAQLNLTVGALEENADRILEAMEWAEAAEADVLLLPELAVTGYPPEDLVMRSGFLEQAWVAVERLAAASGRCTTVVGFPRRLDAAEAEHDSRGRSAANSAAVLRRGAVVEVYDKVLLPNYAVFDENRYFVAGEEPDLLIEVAGVRAGVSVCEDIWREDGPPTEQAEAGARILLNINASPFHHGKALEREQLMRSRAIGAGIPLVYLNLVGGQDELVFDGCSLVVDERGELLHRSPQFEEDQFLVDVPIPGVGNAPTTPPPPTVTPLLETEAEIYTALEVGLRDYVDKNGFGGVVIGLSGGIDSALTAAIAADALGPDRVLGVTMPSHFSSEGSVTDAEQLARNFGFAFHEIAIEPPFDALTAALTPVFEDRPFDVAEENIQARIRGLLLMAISNKLGPMVLTTGNKSEMAVGYATLYGDMAGGYSVLKDVLKTEVFRLAKWRNRYDEMIPDASITKPPSAELRPDQRDSDSLPPYDLLDAVLERYVEEDRSVADIVAEGFDEDVVRRITRLVDRNEYKRRQAAPGVRITTKAFGKDRRLPITNRYNP